MAEELPRADRVAALLAEGGPWRVGSPLAGLTRLSHLAAYTTPKPFVFNDGFAKVCTTF
jgi:hypothetical protein